MRLAVLLVLVLVGCHKEGQGGRSPLDWRCVKIDDDAPRHSAGVVSYQKLRFTRDGFETHTVWDSGGRHGRTDMVYTRRADGKLVTTLGDTEDTTVIDGPPGAPTGWTSTTKGGGYDFWDKGTFDATGLTITSNDPENPPVHFHDVPCTEVDAALAAAR